MARRLRHSVAADPRERAEMNALLVATDQKDAPRVRAMIEGAANPDAVVDKAHAPLMPPRRGGGDWAKLDGKTEERTFLRVLMRGPPHREVAPRGGGEYRASRE